MDEQIRTKEQSELQKNNAISSSLPSERNKPSLFRKRQLLPAQPAPVATIPSSPVAEQPPATPEVGPMSESEAAPTEDRPASAPGLDILPEISTDIDLTDTIPLPPEPALRTPTPITPWQKSAHAHIIRQKRKRTRQVHTRKRRVGRIWSSIFATLLLVSISSSLDSSFNYYWSVLPRLQNLLNKQIEQSSHIYDRNGNLLYTLYDPNVGRSTSINYEQIPGVMQDAQIAAEDKSFWTNSGVDITATVRSAIIDLVAKQVESGASTLTQQVIKNLSGDADISSQRKLSEAALAIGLTRRYPKWKIMEMYFNIASYGAQNLGVEAAAQDYFGLKPQCDIHFNCTPATAFLDRDLSHCTNSQDESSCQIDPLLALARASLLAGIPQNPVNFDPMLAEANRTALLARQDYVLNQMLKAHMQINLGLGSRTQNSGVITANTVQQVETLSKQIQFVGFQNILKAPHFVWWVINQLANELGNYQDIDAKTGLSVPGLHLLLTGGFNIRTTLDLHLEQYVEQATQRHLNQSEVQKLTGQALILSKDSNINDAATVVMSTHTGEILAMNGSASWTSNDPRIEGELNGALTPRQPASTFKPIVMAAAFELGWYPGIVLQDTRTYFPIVALKDQPVASYNTYEPTDYGNTYSWRSANIDFAISNSLNIPAIKAYMFADQQNVYRMAERLGITTIQPKQVNPTIALGTAEVPLLQMVGAYQTFANEGVRVPPHSILSISDNFGHLFYTYDPTHPDGEQVISPQIAYLITSILSDEPARSYEFHDDHDLSMWDWELPDGTHPDVAAKTGTTDNFKDNWTIGYTPDLVVGVWAGNANGASASADSIGMAGAAPLWHSIIEYASGHCNQAQDQIPCPTSDLNYTDRHFSVPSGLVKQEVNLSNGLAGTGYDSWMLNGEQPTQNGF